MPRLSTALRKMDRLTTAHRTGHDQVNTAGGLAFQSTPQAALYRQIATSLWSGDGYYEREAEGFARFVQNVAEAVSTEPEFAFKLAAYGRDRSGLSLRTSPVALYAEASTRPEAKGSGLIRRYAERVLLRADDPSEAIAYLRLHHRALPAGLVRGVGDAMRRFDAYQLGKYKSTGQTRNMLRLGRPKPRTAEERELWGAAVKGGLPIPYTWESELSKATTDDEKRAVWNELLRTKKLGLFALIRNIRNIAQVGADLEEALEQITRERVVGSGILPFQWYKAWQAVQPLSVEVAQVFLQAITWSLEGAEKLPGRTLVACDNSGSMAGGTQTRGLSNLEIANLMGAMALTVCEDGIAGTFGDEFALAQTSPALNLLANKGAIDYCGQSTGSSTNAWKVFQTLTEARVHVDRVVLLSDMQCYDSATAGFNRAMRGRLAVGYSMAGELEAYRQAINPNIVVYSINLTTQDNSSQFAAEQPVVELAGFSESIFRFMAAMEAGESVLDRIRKDY